MTPGLNPGRLQTLKMQSFNHWAGFNCAGFLLLVFQMA